MTDEKPKKNMGWDGSGMYAGHPPPPPGPPIPYKTVRLKRRRKGQLNDGEWAPGYGPDARKTPKP
jgi:hypothetical protein